MCTISGMTFRAPPCMQQNCFFGCAPYCSGAWWLCSYRSTCSGPCSQTLIECCSCFLFRRSWVGISTRKFVLFSCFRATFFMKVFVNISCNFSFTICHLSPLYNSAVWSCERLEQGGDKGLEGTIVVGVQTLLEAFFVHVSEMYLFH